MVQASPLNRKNAEAEIHGHHKTTSSSTQKHQEGSSGGEEETHHCTSAQASAHGVRQAGGKSSPTKPSRGVVSERPQLRAAGALYSFPAAACGRVKPSFLLAARLGVATIFASFPESTVNDLR